MPAKGVQDLSVITDRLLSIIRNAITAAAPGFAFTVSGSMPETVRNDGNCQVSFYLYHVGVDRNVRNTPVTGPQLSRQRPLGLELYYLLTAFAGKEYVHEQHALTIAMRSLQDNPFVRLGANDDELTVTLEMEGIDKLGVLWQAVSAPFRLSTVYKASIAFLAPTDATPPTAPKPTSFRLIADPAALPFADAGVLLGTVAHITYFTPDSTPGNLKTARFDLSPATIAPGGELVLLGAGLNTPATSRLYLLQADGTGEQDITAWKNANAQLQTASQTVLNLPASVGAVPANAPTPGVYQIRVGDAGTGRTNAVPVSIAAAVVGIANPPILAHAGGLYTISGAGFIPTRTAVLLETTMLTESAGAPAAGEFQIGGGGNSIVFRVPATLAAGRYGVRVRVNGVESKPSWWINL